MNILDFSKRQPRAFARGDWSQQEVADIYRVQSLLQKHGLPLGIERGLSDIGDPWLVLLDEMAGDVFLHVARIDHTYILVCESLDFNVRAQSMSELLGSFESRINSSLLGNQVHGSNVVTHPASRLVLAISSMFLLSRLYGDNAEASAGTFEGGTAVEPIDTRKVDGLWNRALATLARSPDIVDFPSAVAAGAAVIVAHLIAVRQLSDKPASDEQTVAAAVAAAEAERAQEDEVIATEERIDVGRGQEVSLAQALNGRDDSDDSAEVVDEPKPATDHSIAKDSEIEVASPVGAQTELQTAGVFTDAYDYVAPSDEVVDGEGPKIVDEGVDEGGTTSLSLEIAENLIGQWSVSEISVDELQFQIAELNTDLPKIEAHGGEGSVSVEASELVSEIDIGSLSTVRDKALSVLFTTYDTQQVTNVLVDLISSMGDFSVEMERGDVLFEQKNIAGYSLDSIAVWTNVMYDGSEVSVVGIASEMDNYLLV